MRFTHLTSKDYVVSNWSGGKTIQIAIAPEGAVYADRDFLWRVSSATADLDESDYTPLPDYARWLSVFDLLSGGQPLEPQGADTMLLYCAEGSGTVGEISLKAEEAVLVQDVKEDTVTVTGSGKFMLARMKG